MMPRADALIDAALTVTHLRCWPYPERRRRKRRGHYAARVMRQVARDLDCGASWRAIEDEIVCRLLAEPAAFGLAG